MIFGLRRLFEIARFLEPGAWGLRGYRILIRKRGERDPMGSFRPTTYRTVEELQQIASAKFEEAAALPVGPRRQQILKSALAIQRLASAEARRELAQ